MNESQVVSHRHFRFVYRSALVAPKRQSAELFFLYSLSLFLSRILQFSQVKFFVVDLDDRLAHRANLISNQ